MFIKRLIVENTTEIIREINFTNGLNLILDDTPSDDTKSTGNNVGKTTVLKLIDFCLGSNPNIIFTDTENKKDVYTLVKEFLTDEQITITLILTEGFGAALGIEAYYPYFDILLTTQDATGSLCESHRWL